MKRIIILLQCILLGMGVYAQGESKISISVVLQDDNTIPQNSIAILMNKMKAIVVQNGYIDMPGQRFVLTAGIDILEKGYNSSGMLMQKMSITFYVGDVLENKLYSTTVINTVGVGHSDEKVYNMAFQRIDPHLADVKRMLGEANEQVVDYYTNHYADLISEVERMVEMGQYDEAITQLITVPSVCTGAYNDAQNRCVEIYHKKMDALAAQQKAKTDKEGLVLIQQAKAVWSARKDYEAASSALALLAQIAPEAECFEQVNAFIQAIDDKLRADEREKAAAEAVMAKRNWEFKMRQYEDNLEMAKQKQADRSTILGTLAERFGKLDINIQKTRSGSWRYGK